jgi:DAK2 domain fusion protein YloV
MAGSKELITGGDLRRMIAGAYNKFLLEHEGINQLNVFPVPDGDTGTNMLLTLGAVARAVAEAPERGIGSLSKRAADSAIMGARGNSGVILAQIFRGLARGLLGKDQAGSAEVGKAFQYGVLYAYRAVAKPVEGTILTVAKGIAKGTRRAVREGLPFYDILDQAIQAGESELARTPELLPALKAAGVVDAGGRGLIVFLRGCLEGLGGVYAGPEADVDRTLRSIVPTVDFEIARPYCTEFIIKNHNISQAEARSKLESQGDSLVVAEGSDVLKIHIHTDHPGAVLESALTWGTLHQIKIDNMADQHRSVLEEPVQGKTKVAVISVAGGEGITDIMKQLGAAIVIAGGQSMNPAVEDFVDAIHSGIADQYIILPNNNNIVLAAAQVKKLVGERAEVVPTVNIPQGLAALIAFAPEKSLAENVAAMNSRLSTVQSGAVTMAVRDCMVGDCQVAAGSYIGVADHEVVVFAETAGETLVQLLQHMIRPEHEVVSLYYGADLTWEQAHDIVAQLTSKLGPVAVELYFGGQPHYHFLVSLE